MSVFIEITNKPIVQKIKTEPFTEIGSELIFHGRVRETENGEPIVALEYEYYPGMAEQEMDNLARKTLEKFPIHHLVCIHRVGKIKVGEISLQVIIWSKHREESLSAMIWFISELKKHVPIWKNAITPDGSVIPSECKHG